MPQMTVRTFRTLFWKFAAPIDQKSWVALLGDTKMHSFLTQRSRLKEFSRPAVTHLLIIHFLRHRLLFQNRAATALKCPLVLPRLDHGQNTPNRQIYEKIPNIFAELAPDSFKKSWKEDFYTFFTSIKALGSTALEWVIDTIFFFKLKLRHCRLLIPWKGRTNGNKWPHFTIQSAVGKKT